MKKGTLVKLRKDALQRHARSIPAHAGFTREGFAWRETLRKLSGEIGTIERTFPNSDHVNVRFQNTLIGIEKSSLVEVKRKTKVVSTK